MDDEDIRAAVERGDTDAAFRLLVSRHGRAVYSTSYRVVRSRAVAEDVMQRTMLKAFENRSQLREVDHLRSWLMKVAFNASVSELRREKRSGDLAPAPEPVAPDDVVAALGATQDQQALEACLAALDPALAAAVVMRFRDELSWAQIARVVGIEEDAIRMRVQRGALRALRDCLDSKIGKARS